MGFNPQPVRDFIGNGLVFPIQLDNGRGVISSGFDLIRGSIKNILAFKYGTRFFLAEFGSRINDLLEEPNDEILQNLVKRFIIDAITQWEKRVSTVDSSIIMIDDTSIQVSISYQIRNS